MDKKDKQILKDTALAVADEVVKQVPGLGFAWGLSKALYGASLKLRQKRALEWVEMVRDSPSIFVEEILGDEKFQDGFVYALERYIREKNEEKRKFMRSIFLGFTKSVRKDEFELERMYHVLSILGAADFSVLRDVNIKMDDFHQVYGDTKGKNENIYNLVNAGILVSDYKSRLGPIDAPFVKITEFGREFLGYLVEL